MGSAPRFRVGGWTVTPGLNLLEHTGGSVKIESRPMDVLVCLANRAPEAVSVDELVRDVWLGRVVTDISIYRVINQLRNAFGDSSPTLIETVPKRGYRLVAPVEFEPEHISSRTVAILRRAFFLCLFPDLACQGVSKESAGQGVRPAVQAVLI